MHSADYVPPPSGACLVPLRSRIGEVRAWAIVDEADFAWASRFNWHMTDEGYVSRNVSPRESGKSKWYRTMIHRELLGLERGDKREIDHINRDTLDNRRSNLRICTKKQNLQNQGCNKRRAEKQSKHRGVSWHRRTQKWWAYARIDGVLKSAGYYHDEDEAGQAAAEFRRQHMTHSTD